jgi:hypothetical protein
MPSTTQARCSRNPPLSRGSFTRDGLSSLEPGTEPCSGSARRNALEVYVRHFLLLAIIALLTVVSPVLAQAPPAQVLQAIEQAGRFSDTFVGSYRLTVSAAISKTNGTVTDEDLTEMAVSRSADGIQQETILRATKNGKDTTADARAKQNKGKTQDKGKTDKKATKSSDGELSVGLRMPGPTTVDSFVYQPLASEHGSCRVGYAPSKDHQKDEGISKGEVAWQCETLEPLWATAELVDLPSHVSELKARLEFARAGSTAYMSRLTTDGAGGILFIKRNFHMVMEISELAPSSAPSVPASAPVPR